MSSSHRISPAENSLFLYFLNMHFVLILRSMPNTLPSSVGGMTSFVYLTMKCYVCVNVNFWFHKIGFTSKPHRYVSSCTYKKLSRIFSLNGVKLLVPIDIQTCECVSVLEFLLCLYYNSFLPFFYSLMLRRLLFERAKWSRFPVNIVLLFHFFNLTPTIYTHSLSAFTIYLFIR